MCNSPWVRLGQKRKGQIESTGRAVRISHISRIPQNTSFCPPNSREQQMDTSKALINDKGSQFVHVSLCVPLKSHRSGSWHQKPPLLKKTQNFQSASAISSRFPRTIKSQCVTDFCCESAGVTLVKFAFFHRHWRERSATRARPRSHLRSVKVRKHTSRVLAASRTSSTQSREYLVVTRSGSVTELSGARPGLAVHLLSADGAHGEEEKQTGLKREKEEEKDGLPKARDASLRPPNGLFNLRASEQKNVSWVWNVSVKEERKKDES